MTGEEWALALAILEAASVLPAPERDAYIDSTSAPPEVIDEVRAMLREESEWAGPEIGRQYGRYTLGALLGRGGMGEVYSAHDAQLGRVVALKFLHGVSLPTGAERLVREAQAASVLNHPHIVTVHEVLHTETGVALVMEMVEGESLRPLGGVAHPICEVARWGEQIARGLAAAHQRGIIHGDVKPENVMLRVDGYVKVLDFGLSQRDGSTLAPDSIALGSWGYMSPEQTVGRPLTPATDVFSLGVLLLELATGKHPFLESTVSATTRAIKERDAHMPAPVKARLADRNLAELLKEMLAKDPALRPTAADVALRLARISQGETSRRLKRIAYFAAGLLLACASAYWASRPKSIHIPEPVAVTNYAGVESQPAVSPDGGRVAFIWTGLDDRSNVYVKSIDRDDLQRLTTDPREETSPAWSPDGKWVAFGRRAIDGGDEDVLIVAAAGGETRLIGHVVDHQGYRGIAWWPDGESLIIRDANTGANPLVRLFLDGSKRQITNPPAAQDSRPVVSPDGKMLAFLRSEPQKSLICRMPLASGRETCTTAADGASALAWLADSRSLLASNRFGIREIGPDGKRTDIMQGAVSDIAVGADGSRAVFGRSSRDINIWRLDLASGAVSKFIASNEEDSEPDYSPDGNSVLFRSDRTGAQQLYVSNREGGEVRQLTALPGDAGSGRWSPDGKWIAFDYSAFPSRTQPAGSKSRIYILPSSGGNPRPLTDERSERIVPGWSQDGRWVIYTVEEGGKRETWKTALEGGPEVRVSATEMFDPLTSQDGRWLYYTRPRARERGLWKQQADGGPGQLVAGTADLVYRSWDVRGRRLFFLHSGPKPGFAVLNLETSSMTWAGSPPKNVFNGPRNVAASPDGKSVLFTQLDTMIGDLYALDLRSLR